VPLDVLRNKVELTCESMRSPGKLGHFRKQRVMEHMKNSSFERWPKGRLMGKKTKKEQSSREHPGMCQP